MTSALDAIAATRIIVSLPRSGPAPDGTTRSPDRAPLVVEVCVQEGLDVVAVPAADIDVLDLMEPLGGRAVFGAWGVRDLPELEAVITRGAAFVALFHPTAEQLALARERDVPAFAAALTPTEIGHAAALGPDAVVVHPAEVFGNVYVPHALAAADVVPTIAGSVNSYVAQQWLTRGALAVTTDESFVGDSLSPTGNLGWLRDRARSFATEGRAAPPWRWPGTA